MDYIVICLVSIVVSGLTLFSGFGLGTLLMPAFALFFPVPVAIAATAVVHLLNNIFKAFLVGRKANWKTVAWFAIPAAFAAMAGAMLLTVFAGIPALAEYSLAGRTFQITVVKLVVAGLIFGFAVFDLSPASDRIKIDLKYLPFGGVLSGFFGGLSGHQGAFRSAFLVNAGLSKDAFIGTIVMSSVIVDVARLSVYGTEYVTKHTGQLPEGIAGLVIAACAAAFAGSFLASRLLKKITLHFIHVFVGVMLILIGLAMGAGLI